MSSVDFQVAVIGAGPAGASAAYKLGIAGVSCILIEKQKLPRYKVCGGGLVYRGLNSMSFDISSVIERQFDTIDIFLKNGKSIKTSSTEPMVTMIMRDSFDHLITKKAQEAGVQLQDQTKLTAINHDNQVIQVVTDKGSWNVEAIIAADGVYSPTARMSGWKNETRHLAPALEYEVYVTDAEFKKHKDIVRFDIDAIKSGYGWSFPKKDHLSVGVGAFGVDKKKTDLKSLCMDYMKRIGINEVTHIDKHGFNVPVTPRTDGFVKNNVFLTGDAAGFADPLTAEGISNAIRSGNLAAQSIIENANNIKIAGERYLELLNDDLLPQIKTAQQLAKWFYSHPKLRNVVLNKYGQEFADYVAGIFAGTKTYPENVTKRLKEKALSMVSF
ncbi:hypothetical protein JCM19294_1853 [Nonlabens tegetincola]|uniref:FAD-binding domain-containing protein n=1 Tax=Nonlabens tegetincola TaxID=323273 RepID=A0A090PZX2_9FLAO|nr:geranylgeranyl reductase family protein [Nonlabens tegetincola]GAK96340.1 hypothetical protein JCM19294_1853 [Nonlabens tegetincola]